MKKNIIRVKFSFNNILTGGKASLGFIENSKHDMIGKLSEYMKFLNV